MRFCGKHIFLWLILLMAPTPFAQNIDSVAVNDSITQNLRYDFPLFPLSPPVNSEFGVKAPNQFESGLKLGSPYSPGKDLHRIDFRESQFYTPALAKKRLLIDMGRDPGTFWLSPYTVAFIGLAMLERYYLHEHLVNMFTTKELKAEELINSQTYWPVLEALWTQGPQTREELEKKPAVGFRLRGKKLDNGLALLKHSGLIRDDFLDNKMVLYTPLYQRDELRKEITKMLDNPVNTSLDIRDGLNGLLKKLTRVKHERP